MLEFQQQIKIFLYKKDALEKAGCERIYEDELSGTKKIIDHIY